MSGVTSSWRSAGSSIPESGGRNAPEMIHVFDDRFPSLLPGKDQVMLGTRVRGEWDPSPYPARLVRFADAGADGGHDAVWLRSPY